MMQSAAVLRRSITFIVEQIVVVRVDLALRAAACCFLLLPFSIVLSVSLSVSV